MLWISPKGCPFSIRCCANFDFLWLYLKSWKCSLKRTQKGLPVWPMYLMLQSGQVSRYIPLFSYLFCSTFWFDLRESALLIVLFVTKEPLIAEYLNSFVINLIQQQCFYLNILLLFVWIVWNCTKLLSTYGLLLFICTFTNQCKWNGIPWSTLLYFIMYILAWGWPNEGRNM
jgi:hypothetical protein